MNPFKAPTTQDLLWFHATIIMYGKTKLYRRKHWGTEKTTESRLWNAIFAVICNNLGTTFTVFIAYTYTYTIKCTNAGPLS